MKLFSRGGLLPLIGLLTLPPLLLAQDLPHHKVRVTDPAERAQLVAHGAKLIADYGSYQLFAADATEVLPKAEVRDDYDFVMLNAGPIDTTKPAGNAQRQKLTAFAGKRLHLVQFAGPIRPGWLDELKKTGVTLVDYVPSNTYLVFGDSAALAALQTWAGMAAFVQWEAPYVRDHKVHPRARGGQPDWFKIQLHDDAAANVATLALIDQLKLAPLKKNEHFRGFVNLTVRLNSADRDRIADQPDVISVHPYVEPRQLCERQAQIIAGNLTGNAPSGPGYLAWLASKGFTQAQFDNSSFVVDVTDSGIDNGTTTPNHFGLYLTGTRPGTSRVAYARLEGTPNSGSTLQGCDGHGNLNSHIIAGYDDLAGSPFADTNGFHYGLGICPFVKVGSSVIFDSGTFTSPDYSDLTSRAYRDGARVSNNSWGAAETASRGTYDSDTQEYDALVRDAQPTGSAVPVAGNQEMVIVFAAGNDGSGAGTVQPPGTGKNIISVGAGENVQAFSGTDGSGVSDTGANSANDIISFSSRGPCDDSRKKPDICAPGTHVSGGVAQVANPGTLGTANACYTGDGVSGGAGGSAYFPPGQQFYTASSGTSHSTPGVAGGCALVRQYFINNYGVPPSPAMTKAFLMNSTRYMTGTGANDTLPSNNQGMGGMNLGMAFDGLGRTLRDQTNVDLFTGSGQSRSFTGTVASSAAPFRVTVAWTDAPGATSGNAYKNDLDLTVTIGGNTYKGNVFSGANSITGGSADPRNNVENVFLPAGVTGQFVVTITAANIVADGVPGNASSLDQDFALVIYNSVQVPTPHLIANGATLTTESCLAGNGAIDPNEVVTVDFALKNTGTAAPTNVVATLLATGGVSSPSGAQTYGLLGTNGASVVKSFTFTGSGSCGSTLIATLQMQDGTNLLGTATFNFTLGATTTTFTENFDGVSMPALPAGWTTSNGGGQSAWVTSTTQRDTLPNAAFSTDASSVGSNALVTPVIAIASTTAKLTFRNSYSLEAGSTAGFDGGVLEIKIGAGAFQDILVAGGTFASGGYTRTISSSYGNPLAGRQAWSGSSGGFITTIVNLPASAASQNVQFRWRCATDTSQNSTGWYIDSINIIDGACCSGASAPLTSFTATPTNGVVPLSVAFTDTSTGTITNRFWDFGDGVTSNTLLTSVNHTYLSAGTNTATLIITGPAGSNTATKLIIATPTDSVGDGIPDTWRQLYFGGNGSTTNAQSCVFCDPDGDGFSNYQEFLAGTTPTNSTSALRITLISITGNDLKINFTTVAGKSYDLERSTSPDDSNPTIVSHNIPGTGGIVEIIDTGAVTIPQQFYRVRLLP